MKFKKHRKTHWWQRVSGYLTSTNDTGVRAAKEMQYYFILIGKILGLAQGSQTEIVTLKEQCRYLNLEVAYTSYMLRKVSRIVGKSFVAIYTFV